MNSKLKDDMTDRLFEAILKLENGMDYIKKFNLELVGGRV